LSGHIGSIFAIEWSPDRCKLASISSDGTMRIWDPIIGDGIINAPCPSSVENFRWSKCLKWKPDGRQIAWYGKEIYIWDTITGDLLHTLKPNDGSKPCALAWSPIGDQLASCDKDNKACFFSSGTLYVWNTVTGQLVSTLRDTRHHFVSLDWSYSNMLAVNTVNNSTYIFDMNNNSGLAKIMREKLSIPQALLLGHMLKFSKLPRMVWQEAFENKDQIADNSDSASSSILIMFLKLFPGNWQKSLEEAENENKEDLIKLLYSLPDELKNNIKLWFKTNFIIHSPAE
jgi:WD40 repeat protein